MVFALAHEKHPIETQRLDYSKARRVVVNESLAVGEEGVIDGVLVTSQFLGDLGDAAPTTSDMFGDPASRAVAQT